MNSISGIQQWHTNQYSLPLGLYFLHLKLQPHDRQTAQHISWSQGRSTSPLISESILQTSTLAWTMPDTSCLPYVLLKATMCTPCALTLSSSFFYHVLGLWRHIMWPVMWLHCHVPLHCPLKKNKNKNKIRKNKIVNVQSIL